MALAELARTHKLLIFAGAGVSMPAPSCLPSWRGFNDAVLNALASRMSVFSDEPFAKRLLDSLVATREASGYFKPDYQAQLIEDECGLEYFRVLQALDTEDRNACHDALAALAANGHVGAIVTTNFDRLLERALEAAGVVPRVFHADEQFARLPEALADEPPGTLLVLKVHGSVEAPESMVDTLRQRLAGRPEALEHAIQRLIERHHVLFVGFSGDDLAYDEGYLGLLDAASNNRGFTCLVRAVNSRAQVCRSWPEHGARRRVS